MNGAFEIGGVGLGAQQRALDVIANNIANLNTPAFKRSGVSFSELVTEMRDSNNLAANLAAQPALAGVTARAVLDLDQQGEVQRTGHPLDLAIDGAGFIELMGPHGQTMLWRGGALTIDENGQLAGAEGLPLRAMISAPQGATSLEIGADGVVIAHGASGDAGVRLGQIMLVRPDDPALLERLDGGLYRIAESQRLEEATPGEDGAGSLVQGAIERSNVDINDEMVRLMIVQRAYAANAQVVQAADQLMAIANNLRR